MTRPTTYEEYAVWKAKYGEPSLLTKIGKGLRDLISEGIELSEKVLTYFNKVGAVVIGVYEIYKKEGELEREVQKAGIDSTKGLEDCLQKTESPEENPRGNIRSDLGSIASTTPSTEIPSILRSPQQENKIDWYRLFFSYFLYQERQKAKSPKVA